MEWTAYKGYVEGELQTLIEKAPESIVEFTQFPEAIIINLFDDFINIVLDLPENELESATIDVDKCVKFLEIVGKNGAQNLTGKKVDKVK